jgi:hypothetical protein
MTQSLQNDKLYTAYGQFIEVFRAYAVELLTREAGERWPAWYVEALSPSQRDTWNEALRRGSAPETLIDYPHLKGFVLKYKDLLRPDFDRETNKLATWMETICDVRNQMSHFAPISPDNMTAVFIHMKAIARAIRQPELEEELINLQEASSGNRTQQQPSYGSGLSGSSDLPAWFNVVQPHLDIRQGRLDESIFAANLAEVALGNGREIYSNPVMFFSKTYFTAGLRNVARSVMRGLNGSEEAENRVISLQTGFGGGKTHTLISLYHLAKWGRHAIDSQYASDLLAYTGNPEFDTANIAVFTNTTNDAANGRTPEEGVHIQTIWGELAYQLGGRAAYEILRKNDEQLISPAGLFKQVLAICKPALILVDELADYCVKASARKAGTSSLADQTISFMQELTEAVAGTENCVAVITLPASVQEVGNTPEAQAILTSLQKRVSRVGADTQPVADDEIYEVIRRRLFEDIGDPAQMEAVASQYMALYQEYQGEVPASATRSEYKQRILKSYPFHPELIDVFRTRWASHHDFQRTRGVLRLLAAIVSDLWKRRQGLSGVNLMIHTGVVNFANLDALAGQLKKLYGNGYDSVISADVAGTSSNAFKTDNTKPDYGEWNLTQAIAAVILMNSFGSEGANKGVSVQELKLNLLMPHGFNHNNVNGALDELEAHAHYLYYAQSSPTGKRYWFHTKPNINILINQAKGDISGDLIKSEIIARVQAKTRNVQVFNVLVNPGLEIPEQQRPTLLILSPDYSGRPGQLNNNTTEIIQKIAARKGNTERIHRNTILFLVCSELGLGQMQAAAREYLACEKISREYTGQLETEQKNDLRKRMEDASRQTETRIATAYSLVVKYGARSGAAILQIQEFKDSIDAQINQHLIEKLKSEEWLLSSVGKNLLSEHNLLPTPDRDIKAKDVYEAFIRFDDKPMITGKEAIAQSLQRLCVNGDCCIASGESAPYTRYYLQENVPYFDIEDSTYWLVDKSLKPAPEVPVSEPSPGEAEPTPGTPMPNPIGGSVSPEPGQPVAPVVPIKSITVSGRIPLESYTQIFNSFIRPLAANNIEIEIRITGKSTQSNPVTTSSQEYKIVVESARQLGLKVEEG